MPLKTQGLIGPRAVGERVKTIKSQLFFGWLYRKLQVVCVKNMQAKMLIFIPQIGVQHHRSDTAPSNYMYSFRRGRGSITVSHF
jgi:hypothetical protein